MIVWSITESIKSSTQYDLFTLSCRVTDNSILAFFNGKFLIIIQWLLFRNVHYNFIYYRHVWLKGHHDCSPPACYPWPPCYITGSDSQCPSSGDLPRPRLTSLLYRRQILNCLASPGRPFDSQPSSRNVFGRKYLHKLLSNTYDQQYSVSASI